MDAKNSKFYWPVEKIRNDFPILQQTFPCKQGGNIPFIYLDNAATTQKPLSVIESQQKFYLEYNANIHRSVYKLAEYATQAYENSRKKIAEFIHANSWKEIIFTKGTTESINLVATSFGKKFLHNKSIILLSELEHHSNLIPWQMLQEEKGVQLKFIPVLDNGILDMEVFSKILEEPISLIAIHHASNVLGSIQPIEEVIQQAHLAGIPVLIDAAQSIPHIPIDVQKLDCDFLAFSGHKICGPTGIGVLYGKKNWLEKMPPYQGGGDMIRSVWLDHSEYNDPPYCFEAGTPPIAEAIGLHSAIMYLENLNMTQTSIYEQELTKYTLQKLQEIPNIILYGKKLESTKHLGVFSFNIGKIHPHDIAQFLDNDGIAVRAGHHCCQPIMRKLNIPGTVRVSIYFYNTHTEIDLMVDSLKRAGKFF